MLAQLKLEEKLLDILRAPPSLFLYGDIAYNGSIRVITPFKRVQSLTTSETTLNKKLASVLRFALICQTACDYRSSEGY
jgi:hypothetical protein